MISSQEGCCSLCHKSELPLVPRNWSPERPLCCPCFALEESEAEILTFETPRGGLLVRWSTEQFVDKNVMVDRELGKLYVLAHLLDEHHRKLMRGGGGEEVNLLLVQDYRTSGAIYQVDAKQFWTEMWGFY